MVAFERYIRQEGFPDSVAARIIQGMRQGRIMYNCRIGVIGWRHFDFLTPLLPNSQDFLNETFNDGLSGQTIACMRSSIRSGIRSCFFW